MKSASEESKIIAIKKRRGKRQEKSVIELEPENYECTVTIRLLNMSCAKNNLQHCHIYKAEICTSSTRISKSLVAVEPNIIADENRSVGHQRKQ